MTGSQTILCVEDDQDSSELLQFYLELNGFQVVSCSTSEEGLLKAGNSVFAAIVLDNRLANISGLEICREIRTYDRQTPIIFFSGSAYPKDSAAGLEAGANEYLVKPQDLERIPETLKRLISEQSPFAL